MSSNLEARPNSVSTIEKPTCFVLMPISDPEGYEKGHFRRVYEDIFVPACEKAGFKAIRGDEVRQANLIHLDILQKLIDSPMALCDLSSRNPNALFELGLRQAFDKPVVLVQEIGTAPIFDIAPLRYVEYRRHLQYREVLEDQIKIAAAIEATQDAFQSGTGVNSIVKLLSLTNPATLKTISDADKEPAMLQVIMAELANIRSDFSKVVHQSKQQRATRPKSSSTDEVDEYRGPFSPTIKRLEADIIAVRKIIDGLIKGRTDNDDLTYGDIVEEIENLAERLSNLKEDVRSTGQDDNAEYLALLQTQMKVLNNRFEKYRKSLDDNTK